MSIKIHIYLFLMVSYMFAIGKLNIFLYYYLFVLMHEISHIIVSLAIGIDIKEVVLLPVGVNARFSENISCLKELIISLAGPLASFLFAIILKNEMFKFMNLYICLFNLIPIYPFDGGKILRDFLIIILKEKIAKKISYNIEKIFVSILIVFSLILVTYFKNYYALIITIYIFSIAMEEMKKEKFYGLINYLQTD